MSFEDVGVAYPFEAGQAANGDVIGQVF